MIFILKKVTEKTFFRLKYMIELSNVILERSQFIEIGLENLDL